MRKIFFLLALSLASLVFLFYSTPAFAENNFCHYCSDSRYNTIVPNAPVGYVDERTNLPISEDYRSVCQDGFNVGHVIAPSIDDSCSWDNSKCDSLVGCTDDPPPAQCSKKDVTDCRANPDCRDGTDVCSLFWCMDGDYLHPPGAGRTGSCHYRATVPDCAAGTDCNDTNPPPDEEPVVPNVTLSSPCKDPGPEGCPRIETAFGAVSTNASGFTRWLLGFLLSISGGIIIIIIIISGYRLMTSSGDPEKVKNARDQLTAAIVGLLFIIFSLVILELITRDILGLPGFGSP